MTPGKAKTKKKYEFILFSTGKKKIRCLLVRPSSLSASVVSARLFLCADDFEVCLPCLLTLANRSYES